MVLSGASTRGNAAATERRPPALLKGGFVPLRPARFVFGFGAGTVSLNDKVAATQEIEGSSLTVNSMLGLLVYDVFMVSSSFGAAFPADNGSFGQVVEPEGGGRPRTADSSLSVMSYSIAAGLRTPFWALGPAADRWVATALFAQYGAAGIRGHRGIPDCVDCREDDLDIPGGTFWQVGFDLLVPVSKSSGSCGLTVSYRRYGAGAGFFDEVNVDLSFWLP